MLLCYLLAEELAAGREGTLETAAVVLADALERTQAAHQALWSQLSRSEKVVLAGRPMASRPRAAHWPRSTSWRARPCTRRATGSSTRATSPAGKPGSG